MHLSKHREERHSYVRDQKKVKKARNSYLISSLLREESQGKGGGGRWEH